MSVSANQFELIKQHKKQLLSLIYYIYLQKPTLGSITTLISALTDCFNQGGITFAQKITVK